jgi:hypothetical protein
MEGAADVEAMVRAVEPAALAEAKAHVEALATVVEDEVGALELDAGAQQRGRPC